MSATASARQGVKRDFVTHGIAVAAVIMFVGTGGQVLPKALRAVFGDGEGPDQILASAMLLNIALILLGWRRFRELAREVVVSRKVAAEALELAETDPLTGCLNRRSINDAADALLEQARTERRALAFAVLDLDNFKHVNDLHSHQAGDAILRAAAERLRSHSPAGALLARMGGDEFACIIPFDPRRPDQVEQQCADLVDELRKAVEWNGMEIEATVSLGLARSDSVAEDNAQTLLHKADIAMFHAKRQGRNRIAWFAPAMESELRFRSELEAGIRRGVAAGEFIPFYEKQIDLATGELVGFEMLARWMSPTLGRVGPDIFIPVAEEIGAIAELSESVIRQALRDARDWDPKLTLAVNISPVQLRDPWFAQKLLKLLVEANFPPHRLEIEITESSLHENIGLVRSMITSLKNQGIRVSLDDFGTGYSSLAQLRSLPFDRIKIDRSFISSLPESEENRTIVKSIVALGEGLGMPVTAEGVESEAVLAALGGYDGLKAQGYLYGQPQPADVTLANLRQLHPTLERRDQTSPVDQTTEPDAQQIRRA